MEPIPLHLKELSWIQSIQDAIRGPVLDRFFVGMNSLDSAGFAFLVVTVVWYLINRRIGIKLLYILILSAVINRTLKLHLDFPRPCHLIAPLGLLCPSSPGLPSGAAQTAILYAGVLFLECRKWLYRVLGIAFALLLCFSRIYLGVHFFTDVLAGIIIGALLLCVYKFIFPVLEKNWKKYALLFPIVLLAIGQRSALFQSILITGVVLGLLCGERFNPLQGHRWVRCFLVLLGGALCLKAASIWPQYQALFALIAGFWLSLLGCWVVDRFIGGERRL